PGADPPKGQPDDITSPASQAAAPAASNPKGAKTAAPPVEVRGLEVVTENPSFIRVDLVTGGKVKPIVRYTPGTTQMLVDIPNALLALPDGEGPDRKLKHPLISGVRMETIQGAGAPTTRLTLDTARIL